MKVGPASGERLHNGWAPVALAPRTLDAPLSLRNANVSDAADMAHVLFESRRLLMPYLPTVHSPCDIQTWVATQLVPSGGVTLACADGAVVGVLAASTAEGVNWIDQLYVAPAHARAAIGSLLLNHALAGFATGPSRPLRLYTFQANLAARQFYEKHGFVAVAFSDGLGTEERCADVIYERSG